MVNQCFLDYLLTIFSIILHGGMVTEIKSINEIFLYVKLFLTMNDKNKLS